MTEAEAWRLVALLVNDAKRGSDDDYLCGAVSRVCERTGADDRGMAARIFAHLDAKQPYSVFAYPYAATPEAWRENRDGRVMAALWMACEAEEEGV